MKNEDENFDPLLEEHYARRIGEITKAPVDIEYANELLKYCRKQFDPEDD